MCFIHGYHIPNMGTSKLRQYLQLDWFVSCLIQLVIVNYNHCYFKFQNHS